MRIWDVDVTTLDGPGLLGEHAELHAIWAILTQDRPGYRHHPEVRRWEGHLAALWDRHRRQSDELARRGYHHRSPLGARPTDSEAWPCPLQPIDEQVALLRRKIQARRRGHERRRTT